MEKYVLYFAGAYLIMINLVAAIITCIDKHCAKSDKRRIPEKTLFIIAAMGGAALMYITMRKIRHKTLHKRFMIGLPVIIIFQAVLILFCLHNINKKMPENSLTLYNGYGKIIFMLKNLMCSRKDNICYLPNLIFLRKL